MDEREYENQNTNDSTEYIEKEYYYYSLKEYLEESETQISDTVRNFFKNILVSFHKCDSIVNFTNREEGPLLNLQTVSQIPDSGIIINEDGNFEFLKGGIKNIDAYCAICGEKVQFDSEKFYSKNNNDSYVRNHTINNKIHIKYTSCENCLNSIKESVQINHELKNPYLLALFIKMVNYIGFEYCMDLNKGLRFIYPVDRLYMKKDNYYFYISLINLADYGITKFESFFKEKGYTEEEIDNGKQIVFTQNMINKFDPEKEKIYLEFEEWLKNEAILDLCDINFQKNQIEGFKYKVLNFEDIQNEISVECLKRDEKKCKNCTGILKFPSLKELYISIPNRFNFENCKAKKYLLLEETKKEEEKEMKDEITNGDIIPNIGDEEQITVPFTTSSEVKDDSKSIESLQNHEVLDEQTEEKLIKDAFTTIENVAREEAKSLGIDLEEVNNNEEEILTPSKDGKPLVDYSNLDSNKTDIEINNEEELVVEDKTNKTLNSDEKIDLTQTQDEVNESKPEEENSDNLDAAIIKSIIEAEEEGNKPIKEELFEESKIKQINKENYSLRKTILSLFPPADNDLILVEKDIIDELKNVTDANERLNKILNAYVEWAAIDIYNQTVNESPEKILQNYGIDKEELRKYAFIVKAKLDKRRIEKEYERINNDIGKQSVDVDKTNYNDPNTEKIDSSSEYLDKIQEKNKKESKLRDEKCNPKLIFRTPDIKQNNPFVMNITLQEDYKTSVFKTVFEQVLKTEGYKAGNPIVTMVKEACFIPIVDFPDVGVRFICVDTGDVRYKRFVYKPIDLAKKVPFPSKDFARTYSINVLYSNECYTNLHQVTRSIFKIVNNAFFTNDFIVRLNNRNYPLAYTTEKRVVKDFEDVHSVFSGLGRVADKRISLIAFVEEDEDSDLARQRKLAERAQRGIDLRYRNSMRELLDKYQMYGITSMHYTKSIEYQYDNRGNQYPYVLYTITQYTENIYCIIEDGFPATVAAIIKEHYQEARDNNEKPLPFSIVYEFDRTALVSPSIRKLLSTTTGIFETDQVSVGQTIYDTITSWVISESRFKKSVQGYIDDRARYDWRLFQASDKTFRELLKGKIRGDEDLTDRERILNSVGFVRYPEPRPYSYNLTQYAIDILEKSPIYRSLFRIEVEKLNQENVVNSTTDRTLAEILTTQFLLKNNLNVEGSSEVFDLLQGGANIINIIRDKISQNKENNMK